ncbi:MAG TPA: hypothetical protein VGQ30_03820 [Gemmatimonadaceae bacterium]|nr:hypothetical protein [Gemmatimonadaceae bacterium]
MSVVALLALTVSAIAHAQTRMIKVVSTDGKPIPYANVSVEGGITQVTDENGDVPLGAGKRQTLTVRVRRIGFTPWFGKVELPDTAATVAITLPSLVQKLSTVTVSGTANVKPALALTGFYDRWLMRQKGVISAVFISPEELEFRHPDKITGMLYGLNGVRVAQACVTPPIMSRSGGGRPSCVMGPVAFNTGGCPMAVIIDGMQQRPIGKGANVAIDDLLDAYDVAAIEVYNRGGNVPISAQFQDMGCGLLMFWTGSRRP